MKSAKLGKLWDSLHASFWFVPTLMLVLAIGLSFITIEIDQRRETNIIDKLGWTYSLGPSGSRAILSAIAGSMMSVATTAFSITIVALQLASSQFGPRLLRNFMRDTGNQIVLGTFIATFGYSLMVLRTINGVEENEFVPHLAVTVGIGLAIASIGVLIYFIHHAAASIEVDRVIKKVGDDLDKTIEQLFPEQIGRSALQQPAAESLAAIPADFDRLSRAITARESGYIQAIDDNQLMQIATGNNLLLRVIAEPIAFAEAVDAAFNQIRQYGQSSVAVTMRLLEAIATIAPFTHRELDRIALKRHAETIERGSHAGIKEELDLQSVKERYLIAVKAIALSMPKS